MENDPKEQSNNPQPAPPSAEIPEPPTITAQSATAALPAPRKNLGNYLTAGLGILIILAIFLPNSSFAQMLAWPIIILGAVAGIAFFLGTIQSTKTVNPLVRPFIIFGGLGVGVVIFIVCLIAGAIIGFAKDPNPQSTG